ncbi:hypothetical protein E3N88_15819 [Mikania micrantha]|uniref:Uncharacterized protein n=1 Tax=Mikania micrantha TaxID=192012 RepID=A0A5N6NWN2_9ASTR|nr:hypothetical protein E3N88_15819 [Mikania micrantha]
MGKPSDSMADIHAAARSGDLVAVQTIISSNPLSVNSRDKHSRTPSLIQHVLNPRLHLASFAGQTQVVNILCMNKADIGAAARDDMGAIHFAAQKGHLEVVRTLISSGVSVKSTNRKGMTPLHYAVQGSFIDVIKYLVKKGANINIKNKAGKSPLDLAANEEIRSLLTSPVDPKGTDKNGATSKAEEGQPQVGSEDQTMVPPNDEGNEKNESNKRKIEDDAIAGTKKTKVALDHLLTCDDTQEDED